MLIRRVHIVVDSVLHLCLALGTDTPTDRVVMAIVLSCHGLETSPCVSSLCREGLRET